MVFTQTADEPTVRPDTFDVGSVQLGIGKFSTKNPFFQYKICTKKGDNMARVKIVPNYLTSCLNIKYIKTTFTVGCYVLISKKVFFDI